MLVTRRPTRPALDPFDRAFQQLTAGFFTPSGFSRRTTPSVDAAWKGDELELTVDLPGVPKEAVSVEVADRVVTISVSHSTEGETLQWSRSLSLGGSLDADGVQARYRDGRLTVTIPPTPAPESRRIEIAVDETPAAIETTTTDPTDES
jgi:HSP20 family protein